MGVSQHLYPPTSAMNLGRTSWRPTLNLASHHRALVVSGRLGSAVASLVLTCSALAMTASLVTRLG